MSYCLDDGSELLFGPASMDEPATAILHETTPPAEAATRAQIHMTDRTAVLPTGTGEIVPKSTGFDKRLMAAPFFLAIIVLGGYFGYRYLRPAGIDQINSVAVLPFENKSGNADTDYLSDGLADSLIYRLSQLPNLKVSPTSSVMRYKGSATDVAQIAKELEVDAVMSGRLTQRGDDLSISVQLIDARTKKLIWAEQYDRKMADLLATQREIATTITQKLQLKLSGEEKGITKKYTDNNEAYQLYLRGRFYYAKRSKDDLLQSIDFYKQATTLDPTFALAYVGISDSYTVMAGSAYLPAKDAIPPAKAAAQRALEIDPGLAEAHAAAAYFLAQYDWNWPGAESEFRRSLELNPNVAEIHYRYALAYLLPVGRMDEAIAEIQRALELEPLSLAMGANLAGAYMYAGQRERGLEQAQKNYNLGPDHPAASAWLGIAYNVNGMYHEAIALGEKLPANNPAALWIVGYAYAKSGRRSEAEATLKKFKDIERTQYFSPTFIASIYAALGDRDNAFAELERGLAERDSYLTRIKVDPFLEPLRDDQRYKAMLKRMNLSE
jgi:TolB-like protein/Tfp pilus assembly protein PilF